MKNSGLTKRERILIIVGVTVLVLFGSFNYLIVPAYNSYVDKLERVDDLRILEMETQMKLAQRSGLEGIRDRIREEFNTLAATFQPKMSNYEFDNLVTGIIVRHDLFPMFLSMEIPESEGAVSTASAKMTASSDYWNIQRLINTINSTSYIYISSFNYSVSEGGLNVDIDFKVQTLNRDRT
jgi:hypothetical protein